MNLKMTSLRISKVQNKQTYSVVYPCKCVKDAISGHMISFMCKEKHSEQVTCGCCEGCGRPGWCKEHEKFHEQALLLDELTEIEARKKRLIEDLKKHGFDYV